MLNEVNNISQRSRKSEFQFDEVDIQSSERPICKPLTALFQEESVTQKGEHHSFPWISNGNRGGCPTSTETFQKQDLI